MYLFARRGSTPKLNKDYSFIHSFNPAQRDRVGNLAEFQFGVYERPERLHIKFQGKLNFFQINGIALFTLTDRNGMESIEFNEVL